MIYEKSEPLRVDPAKAVDLIMRRLTLLGFRIETQNSTTLTLTGPGFRRPRNPLRLISRIEVKAENGSLSATANLNAHRRVFVGLFVVICLLSAGFCVMLTISYAHLPHSQAPVSSSQKLWPASFALIWGILLPLMYRLNILVAGKSLDGLLRDAANNGELQ
jgi:hypothetical protein